MVSVTAVLVMLIAFAGLGLGYGLRLIAREEVERGRRYFRLLEQVLMAAAFVPVLSITIQNQRLFLSLFLAFGLLVLFFLSFPWRVPALYVLFAFMILTTAADTNIYLVQSSLVFLYGLVAGTMLKNK